MGEYGASLEFRVSLRGVVTSQTAGDTNEAPIVDESMALLPGTSSPTRPLPLSPSKKHNMNGHGKRLTFDDGLQEEQEPIGTIHVSVVEG